MRKKGSFAPLRPVLRSLLPLALLLCTAPAVPALEHGSYSMELLVDGVPLEEHLGRGRTYVEALEGREYAVRIRNRTAERIAVALAVDGLNSIDARETTAAAASKWIVGPWETITVEGWQTGSDTARRFFFTTEEQSYGAWLGKTDNLGVVSAAVFRERRPQPAPIAPPARPGRRSSGKSAQREEAGARAEAPGESAAALSDDLAATGIGRRVEHRVRRVEFEAEPAPAAVLQVRYEYRDALVRLGVLPRPRAYREDPLERRERARGFDDLDFAPDPWR